MTEVQSKTTPPALQIVAMTKRFGPLLALDRVSLTLQPGTFHALLGENGAGKSTLVKCVMGFYQPDTGHILIDGYPCSIASPREAHQLRLGMVYQHFTSIPAMTVAENLVLSQFDRPTVIHWSEELAALRTFMSMAPFQLPLDLPVAQLAAGQKQKLEILKQIYLQHQILILDEPTSALTPNEADEVLGLLKQQVAQGHLSVLMITHKFREVTAFADEVTILRKGQWVGGGPVHHLTIGQMAEMMMGQSRSPQPIEKVTHPGSHPVLALHNLTADRDNGLPAVQGISLTVNRGEIVGIAGVSGNGQRELVEVLAGQRLPAHGQIVINGKPYRATRANMRAQQVFVLPEEPLRNACVAQMSVAENLALRTFDRPPQAKGIWLLVQMIRATAKSLIDTFKIKTPSVDTPVGHLSGGNIQRTVLARELSDEKIRLLIAANPCVGLDFAAVDYIHNQLLAVRNQGVAVLLISEELDELLKLSDRLCVMSEGKLVYDSPVTDVDFETIGQRMAGIIPSSQMPFR